MPPRVLLLPWVAKNLVLKPLDIGCVSDILSLTHPMSSGKPRQATNLPQLRNDLANYLPRHIRQPKIPPLKRIRQPLMINAQSI